MKSRSNVGNPAGGPILVVTFGRPLPTSICEVRRYIAPTNNAMQTPLKKDGDHVEGIGGDDHPGCY